MRFAQKYQTILTLTLSIAIFFTFGLYHLTKFETVDEHFWKYDRIVSYWDGIEKGFTAGEWKKTRINDKPGATLALVTLPGRLIERNPDFHRNRDTTITNNGIYTVYDSTRTERINLSLRLPLLIFNAFVMIPLLFLLIRSATRSQAIATISILGIATSPVLIGISQIINPDTLLWSFGAAAFFAFFGILRKLLAAKLSRKQLVWYSVGAGFLTGLALLSKYTANLLFVFYIGTIILLVLTNSKKFAQNTVKNTHLIQFMRHALQSFVITTIVAITTFALLMPAVLQKFKHFAYGTYLSPTLAPIILPLIFIVGVLFVDTFIAQSKLSALCAKYGKAIISITLRILAIIWIALFVTAIANAWLGAPWMPLENVKESISFEKELVFPMFANDSAPLALMKKISIQSQQFIFSIPPLIVLILLVWWSKIVLHSLARHKALTIFILSAPFVFFFGGLVADIYTNARYMILLYPLWTVLVAIAIIDLTKSFAQNSKTQKKLLIVGGLIVFISGILALWNAKPFYFNYQSSLLPQQYVLKDSWGYGSYEAAQYINSLPNAQNLTIWTDRSTVCQFIVGRCVRDYKINLDEVKPDYFVLSRRGSIRHQFIWDDTANTKPPRPSSDYYRAPRFTNPEWQISISNRPANFVKVLKTDL